MSDSKSKETLTGVLRKEEQSAQAWQDSVLMDARTEALRYYKQEPYGDEQEGQSKVVTSEFADTVESLMPSLMRVFAGTDQVVAFTPRKPGDEKWAKEANDYIPHVLMRENDGYRLFYWFCKDALMYRLAGGCVDLEETEQAKSERIEPTPFDAYAVYRQQLEQQAKTVGARLDFDVEPVEGAPVPTVQGEVTTTRKVWKIITDNIAPEDILITADCRDIDDASFVGFRKRVTSSALRALGIKQERIDELNSDRSYTIEQTQRNPDDVGNSPRMQKGDSEKPFWLVVAYVKFDANEDGISEMLRVVYAHAGGNTAELLENDEWDDGEAPVFIGSPILMSHTVAGRSLFDQVKDLQDIATALTRGLLDNVYMTNRPRPVVSDKVNLGDVIDWTPGQPIRLMQGASPTERHVEWLQPDSIVAPALTALQHVDTMKEKRTGITAYNQGLDANSLNKTATGIGIIASAAEQRMELIARTLAEGPFKRMFRLIYRAVKRRAKETPGPVQYWNGLTWLECDPSQWPDDMDLVVDVGPGTGNKQLQIQNLLMMGQAQEKLVAAQGGPDGPLVSMEHAANTVRRLGEALGFKDTSQFVAPEDKVKEAQANPKPPPPSPEMLKVQAQAAADQAKQQSDHQIAMQKQADDAALAQQRMKDEMALEWMKAQQTFTIKQWEAQQNARLKAGELAGELMLEDKRIENEPSAPPANVPQQQVSQ